MNKAIYGLKQSPRCWYDELQAFLETINFKSSTAEPCLFISCDKLNPCYVHVHVEEMTIAGTKLSISSFKTLISNKFEKVDLGEASEILGMTIIRDRANDTVSLSQQSYVKNILKSYEMHKCKPVTNPLDPGTHLTPATEEEMRYFAVSGHNYRRDVSSINYLVQCTKPDLAFSCSQLFQYLDKLGTPHWTTFWCVLQYLHRKKH